MIALSIRPPGTDLPAVGTLAHLFPRHSIVRDGSGGVAWRVQSGHASALPHDRPGSSLHEQARLRGSSSSTDAVFPKTRYTII